MTAYFLFNPSRRNVPQFAPTLDGEQYSCVCVWNLFGQRYYLNCFDLSGNLVFSRPIVDSPPSAAINAMAWSRLSSTVTATTQAPHGYKAGQIVELTIAGCAPAAYNGTFLCVITGASTFTYQMAADPGEIVTVGSYSFLINLGAGYFKQSTIVYRGQQFEVSP